MILFIGDQPSKRTDPNKAFKNAGSGSRLKEWIAAIKRPHEGYQLINQVDYYKFLTMISWAQEDGHPIVALGNNASKALKDIPHFKLPHPSGRNLQINDKEFIAKQLAKCKDYVCRS